MCASHCRLDRAGQTTGHMSLSGAKGSWCRSRWSGRGAKKATIDRPGCQLPLSATSLKVAKGAKVKALWLWADLGGDRKNKDMGFYCLDLAVTRKVTFDKFSFIFKPTFSQENRNNMSWSLQMMSPYHNLERSLSELRRKLKTTKHLWFTGLLWWWYRAL